MMLQNYIQKTLTVEIDSEAYVSITEDDIGTKKSHKKTKSNNAQE